MDAQEPAITSDGISGNSPEVFPETEPAKAGLENPLPAAPDAASPPIPPANRESEIRRAAEMGLKRAGQERAIKEKIKARKAEEQKKGEVIAKQFAEHKQEIHEKKKDYRKTVLARKKDLEAERQRSGKEEQLKKETAEKRAAEQKKKLGYMKELREQSDLKEAIRRHHYNLKLEWEAGQKKAEFEHRQKVDGAETHQRNLEQELEREFRARKAVAETEIRQKKYKLDEWHRMSLAAIDSEVRTQISGFRSQNVFEADRQRVMIEAAAHAKKKRVDNEYKDRRQEIDLEERIRMTKLEDDLKDRRIQGGTELTRVMDEAARELKRKLEELQSKYDALLHGKKG
jgi:hypothetical protein